ncbi:MAG: amidohydrolase family protein [Deltaproteobacteria bacterium]|nr:amidohydrolase family protein [Deltaproteobacteria bacterium]
MRKSAPEIELRLPIKLGPTSNGEFAPAPPTRKIRSVMQRAVQCVDENARRLGQSRREFLRSSCGAATVLLCINEVTGCAGGRFGVEPEAALDADAAAASLGGNEFIFDVQTHHVNPRGEWAPERREDYFEPDSLPQLLRSWPQGSCGEMPWSECYSVDHYLKEIFLDSDTSMAVLSALPPLPTPPLLIEEAAETRRLAEGMRGSPRIQIHGMVVPNVAPRQAQLDGMQQLVESWDVKAWKTYTQWGPERRGWWLDDPQIGLPFIERARQLGVKLICTHKGLPIPGSADTGRNCRDIGVVAKMFPDVTFIVYHSGYEGREGAYDPKDASAGTNSLIRSLHENGIPPNRNVYAELGTTWREVMRDPTQAAHVLGKLLKYVGEDRVLWGTDSIWYGSPQDQIQAFRSFEISEAFQQRYGYPALTPELKAKVLGLNAAVPYGVDLARFGQQTRTDEISGLRSAYAEQPFPSFRTYGPKTRREFFQFLRGNGGFPG